MLTVLGQLLNVSTESDLEAYHKTNQSNETLCPDVGKYPTTAEFYAGLGGYAIALYVSCALVVVVLSLEYIFLVRHFFVCVPSSRRVATLWVNSVYLVVAVATMFCVVLPQSSDFVWLFYRIYLGMAMGYFVDLTLAWYGGEAEMLRHVGDGREINFRVRPCCLCLPCPKATPFSKKKIHFLRGAVYQMPYIQTIVIFLMVILNITGYMEIGDLDPTKPYLYLMIVVLGSFFFGLWALFMFFDITHRYKLLNHFQYRKKSGLLKTIVILVNIQGFVLDSMGKYKIVGCIAPYISATAMTSVIKSIMCLIESFVLGTFCFRLYYLDDTHL